jgi:hypothetical protein
MIFMLFLSLIVDIIWQPCQTPIALKVYLYMTLYVKEALVNV